MSDKLIKDISKLLKEEGHFVKELTDVAVKAAEFHTRLESIKKALETNSDEYSVEETDKLVKKDGEKYSSELEKQMKEQACNKLKDD